MDGGWIGVDLDGTLAYWGEGHQDVARIGPPIPKMVTRVKAWLADGIEVRIVTARVAACGDLGESAGQPTLDDQDFAIGQQVLIAAWCLQHLGTVLRATACKDFRMIALYDDRAVQIIPNTGRNADGQE